MITYKDLFKLIKALPEDGCITASEPSETYRKLLLLDNMEIVQAAQLDEGYFAFYPHPKQLDRERAKLAACIVNTQAPKQVKPSLVVLDAPQTSKTGTPSDLGRVRVDWWYDAKKQQASGKLSDGSYQVKAVKGDYLEIAFELDIERVMTVAKKRTEAA